MKITIVMSLAISLFASAQVCSQGGVTKQTTDVVGQGDAGSVVSADGGRLIRAENGITISINMPTPLPGTYNYPAGAFSGYPEAFTGWAFVFNYPDQCTDPCNGDDIGAGKAAQGGVYNIAGHVSGGGNLQMVGHISIGEMPFGGVNHAPLQNPLGAEIHVAVAPHGILDPSIMPAQIKTPIGAPPFWWLAFFFPAP